jgi:hypothetical protein
VNERSGNDECSDGSGNAIDFEKHDVASKG